MQEIMRESPYFRTIPMQLVQCFIEEDKKHLQLLDQIELVGPLQKGDTTLVLFLLRD